jgi:carboxyl-terminal processing protease
VWSYEAAHRKNTHPNYPLVILINRFSASASEIVAGALADKTHNRAVLVGERTHGKGSVQGVISYPKDGAQLKYTMAYYHLPSGQKVESAEAMKKRGRKDWGVGPNIEIELRSDELRKKFDAQRDNDVLAQPLRGAGLVKADRDKEVAPLKKLTVEQTISADPQLAIGVLIVKTKLIEKSKYNGQSLTLDI